MNSKQKLSKLQEFVNLQAEDDALWICDLDGQTLTALEGYLQGSLRKLHAAIEADSLDEIDAIIVAYKN